MPISLDKLKELFEKYNIYKDEGVCEYAEKTPRDSGKMYSDSWVSSGRTGGNCWDTDPTYYSLTPGDPAKFHNYDDFLDELDKEIGLRFFVGKKLLDIIQYTEEYQKYRDYYGNYTFYKNMFVKFDDIYEILNAESLIE